jgi:hypothetical protein
MTKQLDNHPQNQNNFAVNLQEASVNIVFISLFCHFPGILNKRIKK